MKRTKLTNGAVIRHPRLGTVIVRYKFRDDTDPPELWWVEAVNGEKKAPYCYSERRLHLYLRQMGRFRAPYYDMQ